MVELFDRDQSVISRHINNSFDEEVDKDSNMHFLHIANSDKPVAQAKMLATAIEGDSDEVLKAVNLYTNQMSSELRRNRARLKEYWLLYIRMYLEEKFILLWRKKTS